MGYQSCYCAVCGLEPTINGGDDIEKCLPIEHLRYKWLNKMIAVDKDGKKSGLLRHYGDGSTYKTVDESKTFYVDGELLDDYDRYYYTGGEQPGILMHENCYKLAKEYFKENIKKKKCQFVYYF